MVIIILCSKDHHSVESKEFGNTKIVCRLPSFATCTSCTSCGSRRSRVGFIVHFVPTYIRCDERKKQSFMNDFMLQSSHEKNDDDDDDDDDYSFQKTEKFRSKWNKKFHRAGGIVYKKSVLSTKEFQTIQSELQQLSLTLKDEKSSSVAKLRKGAQLPYDSPIVQILSNKNGSIYQIMNDIAFSNQPTINHNNNDHTNMILSTFIPVEVSDRKRVIIRDYIFLIWIAKNKSFF